MVHSLQQLFLGASPNQRRVTYALFAQLILLACLHHLQAALSYPRAEDHQDFSIDLHYYFTFLIGYAYLTNAFASRNAVQLKGFAFWLIAQAHLLGLTAMRGLTSSVGAMVLAVLLLGCSAVQLVHVARVIGEFERYDETSGFDSGVAGFHAVLKLTAAVFMPAYFGVLAGAKPFFFTTVAAGTDGDEQGLAQLLVTTAVSLLATVGFVVCGTARQGRLGLMLYFALLVTVIVDNAYLAMTWIPSHDTVMGGVGAANAAWCLLLLAYSLCIVGDLGKDGGGAALPFSYRPLVQQQQEEVVKC